MALSVSLLLLLIRIGLPGATEDQTGMVYGDSPAFFITAPHGWVLDNQSGARGIYT